MKNKDQSAKKEITETWWFLMVCVFIAGFISVFILR